MRHTHVSLCGEFMSELQKSFPASLDEVLIAVKETERGRWFLENYEARLRSSENTRMLEAIHKLEAHVISVSKSTSDTDLVNRAREAISAARRDIGALEPSVTGRSAEASLFAHLANKARQSFSGAPETSQSVARALQLVGDLDRQFTAGEANLPLPAPAQLFNQDEAIFEPAPRLAAVAVSAAAGHVEASPRGAKLLVHRIGVPNPAPVHQNEILVAPAADLPEISHPATSASTLVNTPVETPKGRIIIIRRKADEMEAVPLIDQTGNFQAAPNTAA